MKPEIERESIVETETFKMIICLEKSCGLF